MISELRTFQTYEHPRFPWFIILRFYCIGGAKVPKGIGWTINYKRYLPANLDVEFLPSITVLTKTHLLSAWNDPELCACCGHSLGEQIATLQLQYIYIYIYKYSFQRQ